MSVFVRAAFAALVACFICLAAAAESAWVKDDLRLNLRTGAGTEFRIIGVMKSGDHIDVLARQDGWTQVRSREGVEGWIPEGYLQAEATAGLRLASREGEVAELQEKFSALDEEAQKLRDTNATLKVRDVEQTAQVDRLSRENMAYRAGARWPDWITGAGILSSGMLVGWILKTSSGRRRSPRVRL